MRYGAAALVACLLVVGAFALPLICAPDHLAPKTEKDLQRVGAAEIAGNFNVLDGAIVEVGESHHDDRKDASQDEGDCPSGYEIVSDDGIASEHQGGVVVVRVADGCSVDELNAGIGTLNCLAPQSVAVEDLTLGHVKLQLTEGVGVPDALEALGASGLVADVQPNYVYRLDEAGVGARTGADDDGPNLQIGSIVTAPEPIEVTPTGETHDTRSYYDFVSDTMAWNQMVIMAVRLREAYFYTHDAAGNPTAWSESAQRPAIAILDTGCDVDHEDLQANVVGYYDAVARREAKGIVESHGTHVAGIAAAVTNNGKGITGVSLNAKIVSVKVFKKAGNDVFADSIDILAGYEYVINNAEAKNIRIANMSLGSTTPSTDSDDKALLEAVDRAYQKGILTTISAGNDAVLQRGAYSDFPIDFSPQAIGVIDCGVKGVTEDFYPVDDPEHYLTTKLWLTRDSYSNFNMPGTMNKQLAALGSSVLSTVLEGEGDVVNLSTGGSDGLRRYGRKDGTSMASPCVAGVAALALSVEPSMTPDELKSLLYSSAVDVDASSREHAGSDPDPMDEGFDLYTGFGLVDAYNAVVAADTHAFISGKTLMVKDGSLTLSIPAAAGATDVEWSSSDSRVARIEQATGASEGASSTAIVKGCSGGQAVVSAKCTVPDKPSTRGVAVEAGATREIMLYAVVTVYDMQISGPNTVQLGESAFLGMSVSPGNGTWEWSSSSPGVRVDRWAGENTGEVAVTGLTAGSTATVTAALTSDRSIKATKQIRVVPADAPAAPAPTPAPPAPTPTLPTAAPSVRYRTHVQNVGWQDWAADGAVAGTSGRSLRLEGLNVELAGAPCSGGIRYRTHVQNIGWQDWAIDGAMAGTTGRSLRLEAVQVELTGEMAARYDVYCRVHCQNVGWMGWARNGAMAGTAGFGYRLEAMEIRLVPKGAAAPGSVSGAFRNKSGDQSGVPEPESLVAYRTHVQNDGWQNYMYDGEVAGTSGRSLRLEGINVRLGGAAGSGGIEYRTHVQNIGWQDWRSNDALAGTSGRALRLEAIEVRLTGWAANRYDVYYRVHCQNLGWMGWAKNGERAGTAGHAYRLEAIQIELVPKGAPAPGPVEGAFRGG